MNTLTANEQALEKLMHDVSALPNNRKSPCLWATINGREIMCAAIYNKADNAFRGHRFVVDGKSMKAREVWRAVRV